MRISDDKAADELGVKRQEHECRELARRLGWGVAEVYRENSQSASDGSPRPTYERLLEDLASGAIDGLIAHHPDRLYRTLPDLEVLIDAIEAGGAQVITVDAGSIDLSTAAGRMVARQLGVAARYETERKAERCVSKHEELARDGKPSGGPAPYGYTWKVRPGEVGPGGRVKYDLVVCEAEAAIIAEAAERVLAGELISHVVADLTARGVRSRRGPIRPENLARVLCSGRVAGLRERYGEVVGPARWPAIITADQHGELVGILRDPTRARTKPFTASLLGGGLARCGLCGSALHAGRRPPNGKQRAAGEQGFRVYICASARGGCGRLQVQAHHVEAIVADHLWAALGGPGLAKAVALRVPDGSAAHAKVQALEAKLAALGEQSVAEDWSPEFVRGRQAALAAKLAEATAELGASRRGQVLRRYARLGDLRTAWPTMALGEQRTIVGLVIEGVVVGPATRQGRTFDPTRVEVRWRG